MPPRHGKSSHLSHYTPAWFLGNFPRKRVMLATYEAEFAATWGRKARDVLTRWSSRFGVTIRPDSKAADRWELTAGGAMYTAGVGGPITGRGADLFIIDDPVKNAEQALSPAWREKAWDWYTSTAYTRLEPGAAIVILQTRWHTQDLMGRILAESGESWEIIDLPAFAGDNDRLNRLPGEPLWPERYNSAALEDIRRTLGPSWFSALYQQRPLDLEGGFFRGLEKLRVLAVAPTPDQFTRRVRFWDLASTEAQAGADPDYTAGVLMGKHRDGTFWVLDVIRERLGPAGVRALIRQTAQTDGTAVIIRVEREGGASGKLAADAIIREDLAGFAAASVKPKAGKAERAEPWAAQVEAGNVVLVKGRHTAAFLDEHRAFPSGAHDDMVDSASGGFSEVCHAGVSVWIDGEQM